MRNINLDLDGVLADFYGTAERILGCPYRSLTSGQVWGRLEQEDSFFRYLPLLKDALTLWAGVQGQGNLRILTALPQPTGKLGSAPGDKRAWVRQYISPDIPVILVSSGLQKAKLAAQGDILIDDLPRNIDAWVAAGGTGILHRSAQDSLNQLNALNLLFK